MKKLLILILMLLMSQSAIAWRMNKPLTLTHPMDERQVRRLNDVLNDLWNITNGRINLNIVTTTPTTVDNGDIWLFDDSGTMKIQARISGTTYSWTSD